MPYSVDRTGQKPSQPSQYDADGQNNPTSHPTWGVDHSQLQNGGGTQQLTNGLGNGYHYGHYNGNGQQNSNGINGHHNDDNELSDISVEDRQKMAAQRQYTAATTVSPTDSDESELGMTNGIPPERLSSVDTALHMPRPQQQQSSLFQLDSRGQPVSNAKMQEVEMQRQSFTPRGSRKLKTTQEYEVMPAEHGHANYDSIMDPKLKLPASGLRFFGANWAFGAEDMCLPAMQSCVTDTLATALAAAAFQFYSQSTFDRAMCSSDNQFLLEFFIIYLLVVWVLITATDMAITLSAYTTTMFKHNNHITKLMYTRIFLALALAGGVMAAVFYFVNRPMDDCTKSATLDPSAQNSVHWLRVMYLAVICVSFIKTYLFFLYTYWASRIGRFFVTVDHARCTRRIYKLVRSFYDKEKHGDPEILESIALLFTEFFGGPAPKGQGSVTPSDVIVGCALVEGLQRLRKENGHKFKVSAPYDRWEKVRQGKIPSQRSGFEDAGYTVGKQSDKHTASGQGLTQGNTIGNKENDGEGRDETGEEQRRQAHGGYTNQHNNGEIGESRDRRQSQSTKRQDSYQPNGQRNSSSNRHHQQLNGDHTIDMPEKTRWKSQPDAEKFRDQPHLAEPRPDDPDPAELANEGIQPKLWPEDWERLAEAKHFGKYAFGAYGWLLMWYNQWFCCLTCKTARWLTKDRFDKTQMIGSGIPFPSKAKSICNWSVHAFLLTTKIPDHELLYCHIIGSPVYYVAVDRTMKALVVAIRGSLSISDIITDLDAKLIALDDYGVPGGYTHKGLFNYALRAIDDIEERGVVEGFLQANPDYELRLVGHSLGAAISPLITLLWKDRFPKVNMRCIAYSPPHLFNYELAESDWMKEHVTSIVYQNDLVPRLSLSALWRLKNQMIYAFQLCHPSKFTVMNGAINRDMKKVFVHPFNQNDYDILVNQPMEASVLKKLIKMQNEQGGDEEQTGELNNEKAKHGDGDNQESVKEMRHKQTQEFNDSLRPSYLPGRLYHLVPLKRSLKKKRNAQAGWCGKKPETIVTVYAAAQESFREIWVSRSMFLNHMPSPGYTMEHVPTHPAYEPYDQYSKENKGVTQKILPLALLVPMVAFATV